MNPLIPIHVLAGGIALLAGYAGLPLAKGTDLHARIGSVFFAAMLVMAGTGSVIAMLKPERGTAVVGLLTCYLVATSWATARGDGRAGTFERAGFGFALALSAIMLGFGLTGLAAENGRVDSLPAAVHFPFAALAAIAGALDLHFLLRRQLSGKQRIARHLWRMFAALLIAPISFFLGRQMPDLISEWRLQFAPLIAALVAMTYWIFRVRFGKAVRVRRRRLRALAPAKPALEAAE